MIKIDMLCGQCRTPLDPHDFETVTLPGGKGASVDVEVGAWHLNRDCHVCGETVCWVQVRVRHERGKR